MAFLKGVSRKVGIFISSCVVAVGSLGVVYASYIQTAKHSDIPIVVEQLEKTPPSETPPVIEEVKTAIVPTQTEQPSAKTKVEPVKTQSAKVAPPAQPTQPVTQPTQPVTQPTQPVTQPTQPVVTTPAKTFKIDQDKLNNAGLQREIAKRNVDSAKEYIAEWQKAFDEAPQRCLDWIHAFEVEHGFSAPPSLIDSHCGFENKVINDNLDKGSADLKYWADQYWYWDGQYNITLQGYWE